MNLVAMNLMHACYVNVVVIQRNTESGMISPDNLLLNRLRISEGLRSASKMAVLN